MCFPVARSPTRSVLSEVQKPGGGKLILTTVGENEAMLRRVHGALGDALRKTPFMPAMQDAKLPYQYSLFVNYDLGAASHLAAWNDEVPDEFRASNAARMADEAPDRAQGEAPVGGAGLSFEELLERELQREAARA